MIIRPSKFARYLVHVSRNKDIKSVPVLTSIKIRRNKNHIHIISCSAFIPLKAELESRGKGGYPHPSNNSILYSRIPAKDRAITPNSMYSAIIENSHQKLERKCRLLEQLERDGKKERKKMRMRENDIMDIIFTAIKYERKTRKRK